MQRRDPFLIIANPTSGRGRGRRAAESVAAALRAESQSVDIAFTTQAGDAERFARDACAGNGTVRTIVACGGDGTVQQVASVLAAVGAAGQKHDIVLALAPAGRCNDFARALGISRNIARITQTLLHGELKAHDLGRVNDRYFCTVATLGLDAEVTGFVDRMKMPLRGTPAYLYGAVRVLFRYRPPVVRIHGDFGIIEKPVFIATTANTAMYGGAIPIVPHADPTDGTLDVCLIDAMPIYRALPFIPQAVLGRHGKRRGVHFFATKHFYMDSANPLEVWADGERVAQTPVEISVAAGAISVLRSTDK